jgi:hypothetical protein
LPASARLATARAAAARAPHPLPRVSGSPVPRVGRWERPRGAQDASGPGAPRTPSPSPRPGAFRGRGTGRPASPCCRGRASALASARAELGKLFNPFRGAAVPETQAGREDKVGDLGQQILCKFPGILEMEVTGNRGPFVSCQGVLLSQNRTVLPQTLRPAWFPPSAADFLIRPAALCRAEEGAGRGAVSAWGTRSRRGSSGREAVETVTPHPTFDFCFPWAEGLGMPAAWAAQACT